MRALKAILLSALPAISLTALAQMEGEKPPPSGPGAVALKLDQRFPCQPLVYPNPARRAEAVGVTVIAVTLGQLGYPMSTTIDRSAGASREHKMLDSAAAQYIWTCRYIATSEQQGTTFRIAFEWKLEDALPSNQGLK